MVAVFVQKILRMVVKRPYNRNHDWCKSPLYIHVFDTHIRMRRRNVILFFNNCVLALIVRLQMVFNV